MSAPRSRPRVLRAAVALTAAGAAALAPLAPLPAALAQEADEPVLEPLAIRIGQTEAFARLEFAGVVGARARVRREGANVVIRVGTTAAPDLSRLRLDPPPAIEEVQTRSVSGGTEIVLTLKPGADVRTGAADGAVWLNLYAPGQAPAPAEGEAPAAAPVTVRARTEGDRLDLGFAFGSAVPAAVFRRGEAVWIVFDAPGRMEVPRDLDLGPATDLRWAAGPDYLVVRVAAPEALPVSARDEGAGWVVSIGGLPTGRGGVVVGRDDDSGPAELVAQVAGATRAIWLTDPLVGDRFAVVPARGPAKGLDASRQTREVELPVTAQGLAIETPVDDLAIRAEGDLVRIGRPGGLALSPPSAALETAEADSDAPARAPYPALILPQWAEVGEAGFVARYRTLQDAAIAEEIAAAENGRTPIEARLAFARFLLAKDLGFEAIGVLNALARRPGLSGEPELRGLRGAAKAAVGRLDEASADFAAGGLASDPSARVWRGYIAANQADWETARREFAAGAATIDAFPPVWRARFAAAHALAAVETGDLEGARALLSYVFAQDIPPEEQLAARLIQAKWFELKGETVRALGVYKAVGRAPLDGLATPAKMAAVRMELAKGDIDAVEAARRLEPLKWRWRGDATELQLIRTLGQIYLSQGRYREALTTLKSAGGRLTNLPEAAALQQDLAAAFRALFLEGAADGLQPVQALALFYDFRDLTPIGAEGDDMVRRLSRRLVAVDLLGPAAELLQYQVDQRLEGVAKAQVATDLATIYLMNREAEKALQAVWASRTTLLPSALNAERRAVEARALMSLGRYDHAMEVLGDARDPAADDVRGEILWKQEKYAEAAGLYERRLGDRWRAGGRLDAAEEVRLLRAGIGYSLGSDAAGLRRLAANYGPFVEGARNPAALRVALAIGGEGPPASDFAALAARLDTFTGWVSEMKARFRQQQAAAAAGTQTGAGAAAPTPARQAAATGA
jgi:hypothetical protein